MNFRRKSGTSLVEILVVMVVLLVGILAIVQIFPGGFNALANSQRNTIAVNLGRAEIEMLKNHVDQLPEAILPVKYTYSGGVIAIDVQPDRFADDLGPAYASLGSDGTGYDSSANPIGNWQYLTGPNIGRRVLGEGKIIPAPRQVGAYYGCLLTLQFAPVVYNPVYQSIFQVYGNDLTKRSGDPIASGFPVRQTEFWVANEDSGGALLTFFVNPARTIHYRLSLTVYVTSGGNDIRRDLVDIDVQINPGDSGQVPVQSLGVLASSTLKGIEYDSVRAQRQFEDVSALAPDDWGLTPGVPNPDPYEYKLMSPQRGLVLFNPSGYNYMVRLSRGRRDPLIGRVSYDVYDWRIIHEEFMAPPTAPYQYRLAINSLKVSGEPGPDGLANQGIGVQAPDATGALSDVDLVLEDANTGGLFVFKPGTTNPAETSYTVNKSTGLVTLLDFDGGTAGLRMVEYMPGIATAKTVTVDNRTLRALYMGKNEWAVQVLKPAAVYTETWTRPGASSFYIGGSVSGDGAFQNRIYFSPSSGGRMVSIGELYYVNTNNIEVGPVQLTAKVQTNLMDGALGGGLPYIKVDDYFPDFASFDYTYTSAVKSVKGASVAVRVLWNPDTLGLSTDNTLNMDHLEKWMQGWRRSTVETYLQRGY